MLAVCVYDENFDIFKFFLSQTELQLAFSEPKKICFADLDLHQHCGSGCCVVLQSKNAKLSNLLHLDPKVTRSPQQAEFKLGVLNRFSLNAS